MFLDHSTSDHEANEFLPPMAFKRGIQSENLSDFIVKKSFPISVRLDNEPNEFQLGDWF